MRRTHAWPLRASSGTWPRCSPKQRDVYGDPEAALKLRTMLMQYETVKKSKGTVVTVPSSFSDGFADAADKAGADGLGRAPSDAVRGGRQ